MLIETEILLSSIVVLIIPLDFVNGVPIRQLSEGVDDVTAQTRVDVFACELGGARAILRPVREVTHSFVHGPCKSAIVDVFAI